VLASLALVACSRNPYIVGAICPSGGGGTVPSGCGGAGAGGTGGAVSPNATFAVSFDQSGVSLLSASLELPTGPVAPTLRLRGESASQTGWPSEIGGGFGPGVGAALLPFDAPFTDGTAAAAFDAAAPSYVASAVSTAILGGDDLALEVVLRAAAGGVVLAKSAPAGGWTLAADAGGVLGLALDDGTPAHAARVTTEPLVDGTWYHCLFWVSRAAGARADCDGRAGTSLVVAALGAVDAPVAASLGGGASTRVALLSLYRVAAGGLGAASTWLDVSRRRFATLAGARPKVAHGTALPSPGLRATPAYVDLQLTATGERLLFAVGPDWPRVACRFAAGARTCGFLSEPHRTRLVGASARSWQPSELTVADGRGIFVTGENAMAELVPSTTPAPHVLSFSANGGAQHQVLSFFATATKGRYVGAEIGAFGRAVFDLVAGTVVSAPVGPGLRATIEPWGQKIFRCSFAFSFATPAAVTTTYAVDVLGSADAAPFAGDGVSSWVLVAGLQLDAGLVYAGSLLAADTQEGDELTFVGDDGNLPTTTAASVSFRTFLPSGPRLTDQALVNLNLGGSFMDQIQLFVIGGTIADTGKLKFWGLRGGNTHWSFDHPTAMILDGAPHTVVADWDATSARVAVDGVVFMERTLAANAPPFAFDRIDVGFSGKSSGALEGLIAGLEIGAR
jgi:hypothetical protein